MLIRNLFNFLIPISCDNHDFYNYFIRESSDVFGRADHVYTYIIVSLQYIIMTHVLNIILNTLTVMAILLFYFFYSFAQNCDVCNVFELYYNMYRRRSHHILWMLEYFNKMHSLDLLLVNSYRYPYRWHNPFDLCKTTNKTKSNQLYCTRKYILYIMRVYTRFCDVKHINLLKI